MKTNFYLCPASVDEIPWSMAIQMKATVQYFSFSFLVFFLALYKVVPTFECESEI